MRAYRGGREVTLPQSGCIGIAAAAAAVFCGGREEGDGLEEEEEEEEKRKRKRRGREEEEKRKRRGRPSPRCARPSRKPGGFRGTLPRAAVTTGKKLKSGEGREASNASVPGRAKADTSPVAMDWHRCRSGCGVRWWKRSGRRREKRKRRGIKVGVEEEEKEPSPRLGSTLPQAGG
jgi:hypothetical protein